MREMRATADFQPKLAPTKPGTKAGSEETPKNIFLDDNMSKLFCCRKEDLGKAVSRCSFRWLTLHFISTNGNVIERQSKIGSLEFFMVI